MSKLMHYTALISVTILYLCFIMACEEETRLSIDQTAITVSETGGSQTVALTANKPWTACSNQSWCKVSPENGAEATAAHITISCDANTTFDARNCTVTITCAELEKSVSISQETNNGLMVSQTSYEVTNAAQQLIIPVQANVRFTVDIDNGCEDWVKYNTTKGLTSSTVVFDIAENKTYDQREGRVILKQEGGPLSSTLTIKQRQLDALFLSATGYNLSCEKQTLTVEIQSNVDFVVKPEANWIKHIETKGLDARQVVLEIENNEMSSIRTGCVLFEEIGGSMKQTITIQQDRAYIPVTSVTLNQRNAELLIDDRLQLIASIHPQDASVQEVIWSSSDESIATVSDNGLVKAVGYGTTTIIATAEGKRVSCEIVVLNSGDDGGITLVVGSVPPDSPVIHHEGGTDKIAISGPSEWICITQEGGEWCQVYREGNDLSVHTQENLTGQLREAIVLVVSGHQKKECSIYQTPQIRKVTAVPSRRVRMQETIRWSNRTMGEIAVFMPRPETCEYQTIENFTISSPGQVFETEEKNSRFVLFRKFPQNNERTGSFTCTLEYTATSNLVEIDFDKIT